MLMNQPTPHAAPANTSSVQVIRLDDVLATANATNDRVVILVTTLQTLVAKVAALEAKMNALVAAKSAEDTTSMYSFTIFGRSISFSWRKVNG